jgi:hypothetical protein
VADGVVAEVEEWLMPIITVLLPAVATLYRLAQALRFLAPQNEVIGFPLVFY